MGYATFKTNNVVGDLKLSNNTYTPKLGIETKSISQDFDFKMYEKEETKLTIEQRFAKLDCISWMDDKYREWALKKIVSKGIPFGIKKISTKLVETYGDETIGYIVKKTSPIISKFTCAAVTGGSFWHTVYSVSESAAEDILTKNIAQLYLNPAKSQLDVLAEKFAAREVEKGIIDVSGQTARATILKDGGLARIAGSEIKSYSITKAGIVGGGIKNGVFTFFAASVFSIITKGMDGFIEEDLARITAESTGCAVGYMLGSAAGVAIGTLISGPAGAYLGQKIGACVGQIAGSVVAGIIFEHWDDVYRIGSNVIYTVATGFESLVDGLVDGAKDFAVTGWRHLKNIVT